MEEASTSFQLNNLTTGYHLRRRDKTLSHGLTADLRQGELTCLLGANGVGKSTLLRTLAGFQPALSGDIYLMGKPLTTYATNKLARTVGVVLTERPVAGSLTAEELVGMGRMPYSGFWGGLRSTDRQIVDAAIDLVGMGAFRRRRLATLSDGELQKLMIAKVLAQQTPVILLDEPVAFLDFPSKVEVLTLLRRLAREQQKAILLSIHDLELALQTADRLWLLSDDGCLYEGTPHELSETGHLDFFFSQSGLHFDRTTMQYTLNTEP